MTRSLRILVCLILSLACVRALLAQSEGTSGFININAGKLYYESSGDGETIVLIHGFTLDRRMWDNEFSELSKRFRTIRYDLRGHGKSSRVSENFSHVDDLVALLDTLNVKKTHLIGLSLGGWIATDCSIADRDRIHKAILIAPYYPLSKKHPFDDRIVQHISIARQGKLKDGLSRWLDDPLFQPASEHEALKAKLREIVLVGHAELGDGALFVNADKQTSSAREANKTPSDIRCPVLCLVGKRDLPRFHAVADYFSETIPDITVVTVPDSGHMANMENPGFVMAQINGFLAR